MTKAPSKLLFALALFGLFLGTALPAEAQYLRKSPLKTASSTDAADRTVSACKRLDMIVGRIDGKMGERQNNLGVKRNSRMNGLTERRETRDGTLTDKRDIWDGHRQAQYDRLLVRATTDAQKEAVEEFEATIEAAVEKRRSAIDAAIEAFREGIDELATSRKASVDAAIADFKEKVDGIIDDAKAECEDADDPKALADGIRSDMMAARMELLAKLKEVDPKASREALVQDRKEAIEAAIKEFKATAEEARVDLKAAFEA